MDWRTRSHTSPEVSYVDERGAGSGLGPEQRHTDEGAPRSRRPYGRAEDGVMGVFELGAVFVVGVFVGAVLVLTVIMSAGGKL